MTQDELNITAMLMMSGDRRAWRELEKAIHAGEVDVSRSADGLLFTVRGVPLSAPDA